MVQNKYEKTFIDSAVKLDALSNSSALITNCAQSIVSDTDKRENVIRLCNELDRIIDLDECNKNVIALANNVNDNLIKYLGYSDLTILVNGKDEAYEDVSTLAENMEELEKLVGLADVKKQVKDLVAFQLVNQRRISNKLKPSKRTLHMAFIGNPGTGKTTVARIIGKMYKKLGLLSKGHFTEVSRTDLIAGYQGQTALKVKNVIDKAKGGVLFIDEAYSITENDHSDSYGRECLTELTKALEDCRDDLVVIVAGYTEPMRKFFESNPGLQSRFNTFIVFEDYTENQLMDILLGMCREGDYELDSEAKDEITKFLNKAVEEKDDNFSNGRFVRNLYEKLIMNQARRVADIQNPSRKILMSITVQDFLSLEKDSLYKSEPF